MNKLNIDRIVIRTDSPKYEAVLDQFPADVSMLSEKP